MLHHPARHRRRRQWFVVTGRCRRSLPPLLQTLLADGWSAGPVTKARRFILIIPPRPAPPRPCPFITRRPRLTPPTSHHHPPPTPPRPAPSSHAAPASHLPHHTITRPRPRPRPTAHPAPHGPADTAELCRAVPFGCPVLCPRPVAPWPVISPLCPAQRERGWLHPM